MYVSIEDHLKDHIKLFQNHESKQFYFLFLCALLDFSSVLKFHSEVFYGEYELHVQRSNKNQMGKTIFNI